MFHPYTIWRLMRKHTNRQIQESGVIELSRHLENEIKTIVEQSEKLLEYNGTKNQRITKDCIKAVINNGHNTLLPTRAGGNEKENPKIEIEVDL